jgi:hypothetical protein
LPMNLLHMNSRSGCAMEFSHMTQPSVTHDKIVYNFHSGKLMGFAYDALDLDIIKANGSRLLRRP